MARTFRTRDYGAIPERQHDAFLLAILIAVSLNIAVFVAQALVPRVAYLLSLLAAEQSVSLRDAQEEEKYPFVLIDASYLDEELAPDELIEAESDITRRARQTDARPDLDEGHTTTEEGIDETLTFQSGTPGPNMPQTPSPGEDDSDPAAESQPAEQEAEQPGETLETPEMSEQQEELPEVPDFDEPLEPDPPTEMVEDLPPIAPPEDIYPTEIEEPESPPEPPPLPDIQPETIEAPEPIEDEPLPEAVEPVTEEETPEQETPDFSENETEPAPESQPDPISELVDLAMLPTSNEGVFAPESTFREQMFSQPEQYAQPIPRPQQPYEQPRPPQPEQTSEAPVRRTRSMPPIKQIGGAQRQGGARVAGGAPPRRNTSTSAILLDADASMAYLTHKYGAYMRKLAEQLQASLIREAILTPTSYSRGQVKIRFGISADGTLTYHTTVYPDDGSLEAERLLSERMLREAAPFDPLTQQMQQDENFQRMTVIVNLY